MQPEKSVANKVPESSCCPGLQKLVVQHKGQTRRSQGQLRSSRNLHLTVFTALSQSADKENQANSRVYPCEMSVNVAFTLRHRMFLVMSYKISIKIDQLVNSSQEMFGIMLNTNDVRANIRGKHQIKAFQSPGPLSHSRNFCHCRSRAGNLFTIVAQLRAPTNETPQCIFFARTGTLASWL